MEGMFGWRGKECWRIELRPFKGHAVVDTTPKIVYMIWAPENSLTNLLKGFLNEPCNYAKLFFRTSHGKPCFFERVVFWMCFEYSGEI